MNDWLLDTHTWIWLMSDPAKVPLPLRKRLEGRKRPRLLLSLASVWELTIKQSIGRVSLPMRVADLTRLSADKLGLILHPIEFRHFEGLADLSLQAHRDPFDRLLVAQAVADSLSLISKDDALDEYPGLKRLWDSE